MCCGWRSSGLGPCIRTKSERSIACRAVVGITLIRIYTGSPRENGDKESFNGTLRREVLTVEWFKTTEQARIVTNGWHRQYNQTRPHQARDMRAPGPESKLDKAQISGSDTGS